MAAFGLMAPAHLHSCLGQHWTHGRKYPEMGLRVAKKDDRATGLGRLQKAGEGVSYR